MRAGRDPSGQGAAVIASPASLDGEARTQTGDTAIFRRSLETLERGEVAQESGVSRAASASRATRRLVGGGAADSASVRTGFLAQIASGSAAEFRKLRYTVLDDGTAIVRRRGRHPGLHRRGTSGVGAARATTSASPRPRALRPSPAIRRTWRSDHPARTSPGRAGQNPAQRLAQQSACTSTRLSESRRNRLTHWCRVARSERAADAARWTAVPVGASVRGPSWRASKASSDTRRGRLPGSQWRPDTGRAMSQENVEIVRRSLRAAKR
jgi:hypothetical protein